MKTIQAKGRQLLTVLIALVALSCATNVYATAYTANVTSGNWSTTTSWTPTAPAGGPAAGDSASIPSGKTITLDSSAPSSVCTSAGQSIVVGGTLNYSKSGAVLGDITINSGGVLNTTINGTAWTFGGNVTNNGSMTFTGGGSTITATYSGGTSTSPKFLVGNITNSAASISGVYVNLGLFLTGQAGNQVTGITGAGTLTNLGTISYGGSGTPTITKLACATSGNLYFYRGGSGNANNVYGTPYYNFTLDSALQGSFPTFNAGAAFLGMFTDNFGGNGAALPANFTVGAFTMGSGRANNDNIASSATMYLNGTGGWIYNLNKLTFNSGCTVYFTNGASGPIGGSVITPFVNLFIGSNAVVTLTNSSTVSGTLTVTNGGTFNAVANATGTGAFTLRSGGTLGIASASGIATAAATGGIQLSGQRIYEAGANYAYIGTVAQVAGNQLTNSINRLTITNSSGVTLSGNATVTNTLLVQAGTFGFAANTLTLGASAVVSNSATIQGSLTMGSSGKLYTESTGTYGTNIISTNLTMTAGSTINMNVGSAASGPNDMLVVSNTLAFNSTVINLSAPSPGAVIDQSHDYVLVANASGGITGTPVLNWVVAPASSANYTLVTTATSVTLHYALPVAVSFLPFTTQPANTSVGSSFTVVVQLQDSGNNPITSGVITTLSVSNSAATLNGPTTVVSDGSGNATFSGLTINSLGTYNLQVVAGSPSVTNYSATFTIGVGAAAKLGIVTNAPVTAAAGVAFTNSPTVQVLDAFGNVVTSSTAAITVTNTAGNGAVQGTATVNADGVTGSAVFPGLSLTNAGNVTLTFTANGLTSTNSTAIAVSAGAPTQLAFLTLPSTTAAAGVALASQPVLAVKDTYGNTVTTSTVPVDVSASVGGVVGPHPTNAVSGVAAFTGLYLTNINNGNPITLSFTSSGLTGTNSTITVSGGLVAKLAWTTQPGAAVYGSVFGAQPVLQTVDQYGNPTTNGLAASETVTVKHTSGGGAFLGTMSYNIGTSGSNGVISFTDLQINAAGTNHQLTAYLSGVLPTNYPSLQLWLDASDASSTTLSGTSVTTWMDKSGTGHNATNATTGEPIIATNATLAGTGASAGRVVRFNGSSTILGVTGNLTFLAGVPYTIIAMEVANNNGATASYYIGTDPTGTDRALQIGYRSQNDFTLAQYGDDFDYTGATFTYPQARMWTCKANNGGAGGRAIYLNGASVATSANTAVLGTPTGGYIGASFGRGEHYNGDLAEILVYTNALTDVQRSNIENYLVYKWTAGMPSAATANFTVSPAPVTIASGVAAADKVYDGSTNATLTIGTVVFSGVLPADAANVSLNSSGYVAYFANAGPGNTIPVTVSGLTLSGTAATNYSLTQPASLTANISVPITYSGYTITDAGIGSAQAGFADQLTITAVNSDGSTQTGVSGNILLAFSGLSNGSDGTAPTITDEFGAAQTLGATNTLISFTNGISLVGGSLVPHKNETAILQVTDSAGHNSTSPGGTNLNLTVSVGTNSAYRISAAANAPVVGMGDTLTLTVVDKYQNVNTGFGSTPNINFGGLANGPDGSQPTVNGTPFGTGTAITFSGGSAAATLVAHKVESNKLLTAADGTLSAATTGGTAPSLSPSAGTGTQLGISTQPSSSVAAGVALAQQPVIHVLDLYGNTTTSNAQVTATASIGSVQGPAITNAVSGTATFSGLSLTNVGSVTLTFASAGMASTNSTVINVGAGAITQLGWTVQPAGAVYGAALTTQPVLKTLDQFGNPTTNGLPASLPVTISGSVPLISGATTSYNIGSSGGNGTVTGVGLGFKGGVGGTPTLTATIAGYGTPLTGMAVWLDANNPSSLIVSGGQVTTWTDSSGNGNNFTANSGTAITYGNATLGGLTARKVVTFVGNGELKNTTYNNGGAQTLSVFCVFKKTTSGTGDGAYQIPFSTYDGSHNDYQSAASISMDGGPNMNQIRGVRNEGNGPNAGDAVVNAGDLSTAYFDGEIICNSSANTVYYNGLGGATAGNPGAFGIVGTSVGGGLSGAGAERGNYHGDVAELLIYNTALSTTDRQTVEAYLNRKWQSSSYLAASDITATSSGVSVSVATVVPSVTVSSKVYDGTTNATIATRSLSGVIGADDVNLGTSGMAAFTDKNVGLGKTVNVTGLSLSGATAGNYVLSTTSTTASADITLASVSVMVGSSVNPSGFGDSVTFTATMSPADASGNVIFKANGVSLGTSSVSAGMATDVTATLPRGTDTITAEYSGDANYMPNTNSLSGGQVVTNHPPTASLATYSHPSGIQLRIVLTDLAANWHDQDGDPVTLTGVNSPGTNGAVITFDSNYIYYPAATNNDQFTYTISDGQGGTSTGVINVVVSNGSTNVTQNITGEQLNGDGSLTISFASVPGSTNVVQTTPSLTSPVWTPISTNTAGINGLWQFTDPSPTSPAFYRSMRQP
jgi:hypothetical protein